MPLRPFHQGFHQLVDRPIEFLDAFIFESPRHIVDVDSRFRQSLHHAAGFIEMTTSLPAAYALPRLMTKKLYKHRNKNPQQPGRQPHPYRSAAIIPLRKLRAQLRCLFCHGYVDERF